MTDSNVSGDFDADASTSDSNADDELPELNQDDIIYWMGWMMDAQRRLYDVLLTSVHIQCLATGNESLKGKAKELQELHESGRFLYPPAFAEQQGDDDETN